MYDVEGEKLVQVKRFQVALEDMKLAHHQEKNNPNLTDL